MASTNDIQTLLDSNYTYKNSDFPIGTPVQIGINFLRTRPSDWPESTFQSLTNANLDLYEQKILAALTLVEQACGIDFVLLPEAQARILLGLSSITANDLAGYAQHRYKDDLGQYITQIVYDDEIADLSNFQSTITHEILHALGLKHPGHYSSDDEGPYLASDKDNTDNTVMSYNFTGEDDLNLRAYDIAALQYLYGPPISAGIRVGIPSADSQRSGSAADELFALNSYTLWTQNNDTQFTSTDGSAYRATETGISIDGNSGIDEVYIPLPQRQVDISRTATNTLNLSSKWLIDLSDNKTGTLTLVDHLEEIERLHFTDKTVAWDITGNALKTMQLIATIAPALENNLPTRGSILQLLDQGNSLQSLFELVIQKNIVSGISTDLAEQTIRNVFPDIAGSQFDDLKAACIDYIEHNGQARFLSDVASLSLNVNLVGLQQNGMEYLQT